MRLLVSTLLMISFAGAPAQAACDEVSDKGKRFVVCAFDVREKSIKLFWKDGDGAPYGSLDSLQGKLQAKGVSLRFAMNAGMYEHDLSPVGLYVENGRELRAANTRNGPGNFHLKPNGVFFVDGGRAGVFETARYLHDKPSATFATQSGPMLVVNGRIHPKIRAAGVSEKIRNGVGVRDGHIVIFAISREPVTFYAFASLFRDRLKTPDALFLDGSISTLFAEPDKRLGGFRAVGPIVGVVEESKAASR